jgi:hypothetical protein
MRASTARAVDDRPSRSNAASERARQERRLAPAGDSLDDFLDAFPSVRREQAVAALELAGDLMAGGARSLG